MMINTKKGKIILARRTEGKTESITMTYHGEELQKCLAMNILKLLFNRMGKYTKKSQIGQTKL